MRNLDGATVRLALTNNQPPAVWPSLEMVDASDKSVGSRIQGPLNRGKIILVFVSPLDGRVAV